jgi:hypothetical protein
MTSSERARRRLRDFTVTVAGPERHNGEKPYVYVVRDSSTEQAWAQALAWHIRTNETTDAHVLPSLSHDGPPPRSAGYIWNYLRAVVDIHEVAELAHELAAQFSSATAPFRGADGEVRPRDYVRYDEIRADFGEQALELIQAFADKVAKMGEEDASPLGGIAGDAGLGAIHRAERFRANAGA